MVGIQTLRLQASNTERIMDSAVQTESAAAVFNKSDNY